MQPPSRLSGAVIYIEFHVPIAGPEFPDPILTFAAGMSDFATRTDGALFVVRVNGTEVWRTEITSRGLVPAEIDLSRWAGQTVRIRFIVHPGMRLNAGSDLACWTDLQIKFRSQRGSTRFRIALPADASDVSIAGTATEEGSSGNERVARSELPAKFAVFSRAMPMVGPGESLLDRSPAVWRAGYDGSPILSRYETSGQVGRIPSRGEVLRALATVPPDDGKTIATYGVRLSGGTSRLRFVVGLADPSAPVPIIYSQAKVAVRVNGETVWDDVLRTSGWVPGIADLSDWRDRDVIIELEADSDKSGLFDWVHWAELIIE
jgi:hypothetical protein